MKLILLSVIITGFLSIFCCFLLASHIILSIKYKNLKSYIIKISHFVSSARYGNLYNRIENDNDILTSELSKNLNNLLESIIDRDVMINEYVENEKENSNLKQDFIAALTHDLKVPIIAQDNTYDLLMEGKFGRLDKVQKEVVQKLKTSNIDLKYLAEALLETYKLENKGIIVKKEHGVSLNSFVKEAIEQLSSIFELHNKKISFENFVDPSFLVDIDPFLVKRVVNNLILNALSYSGNSDKIDITLKNEGENFSITIKDYGIGIEKEDLDKIFNKYYSGKTGSIKSSVGLGLYLSNKIITALGGKIEVDSKKNEGSAFTIILPCT